MRSKGSNRRAGSCAASALSAALLAGLVACGGAIDSGGDSEAEAGRTATAEKTVTGGEPFHGVLQYRSKDAKLALIRPSFIAAADAELADGISVVGVSIGGVHRAYPLYVLKNHQVVNDTLAEVPVAASW